MRNVLGRTARHIRRRMACVVARARDRGQTTYATDYRTGAWRPYLSRFDESVLRPLRTQISALAELWLSHYFDLLGSGWVQVKHGMQCRGLEGYRYESAPAIQADKKGSWLAERLNPENVAEAARIWQMVDEGYVPIDWQLDFKSGYRWSEWTWHWDIRFGRRPGADIKVPWELARMQHLCQLALAHALAISGELGLRPPGVYAREFRNEVLDFIATNPPRFGVNWYCTMDVAIRVANWLMAYDLFRAWGASFDPAFEAVLQRSVFEHAHHIVNHLERHGQLRANHYLADVVGLLFAAAYLPRGPETDAWLAFAIQELVGEVEFQFYPEGTNFEASTSYHRLSAEMVIFATALVLGLPPERQAALGDYDYRLINTSPRLCPAPLPLFRDGITGQVTPFSSEYFERLEKMARFTMHVSKPSGRIHQVGDNDSGRFLKFQPAVTAWKVAEAKGQYGNLAGYDELPDEDLYWTEDHLDHRSLVAAILGLLPDGDLECFCGTQRIETILIRNLCGDSSPRLHRITNGSTSVAERRRESSLRGAETLSQLASDPEMKCYSYEIPLPEDNLCKGVECQAYPDFGLYVFRSPRLYLAIRCGRLARGNSGGHAHHDQLAVELSVGQEDLIADPGTYLYTPHVLLRNAYRSMAAHFGPQPVDGREPSCLAKGLFQLTDSMHAESLLFEPYRFLGRHVGFGKPVYRFVELRPDRVRIEDYAVRQLPLKPLEVGRRSWGTSPRTVFCEGYGILTR